MRCSRIDKHIAFLQMAQVLSRRSTCARRAVGCILTDQYALMQCPDVKRIVTCYVTTMPCVHCIKMLMNTSCQTIWYLEEYPHADLSIRLWEKAGRTMLCGDR